MPKNAVEDARILLDNYIATTRPIQRTFGDGPIFTYAGGPLEMDMLAFAGVFSNLWEAIKEKAVFAGHWAARPAVFHHLQQLAVPEGTHAPHNGFWVQATGTTLALSVVKDEHVAYRLCRTLRNGFNHFNYRYADHPPNDYFPRLGFATPPEIPAATIANNCRIFICDHSVGKPFLSPKSDTRVLDVGFAHLRYHLYYFLAKFFEAEGGGPPVDLLGLGRS